jgi:hypothetical protein
MKRSVIIDRVYNVEIFRQADKPVDRPRLVVVAYLPNRLTCRILEDCIQAIQKYTSDDSHELWIIDNASPSGNAGWLRKFQGVNLIINRSKPVYPLWKDPLLSLNSFLKGKRHPYEASYANAIALELAARIIHPESKYLMTLHMDTMPCHPGWMKFLQSKIEQGYAGAGVRMDKGRVPDGVLHILGCMFDYQLFNQLHLDFFPELPKYDVGDRVTTKLREKGYPVFACQNTLWMPELIEKIPASSPFRYLHVDRSFDDNGNVIFLHLGRGVQKSVGSESFKTSANDWIKFAEYFLRGPLA